MMGKLYFYFKKEKIQVIRLLVFATCLAIVNSKASATSLEGIKLDHGYINDRLYSDISYSVCADPVGPSFYDACGSEEQFWPAFLDVHEINDTKTTQTIIPLQQDTYQFSARSSNTDTGNKDYNVTGWDYVSSSCGLCAFSIPKDESSDKEFKTDTLYIYSGSAIRVCEEKDTDECECIGSTQVHYDCNDIYTGASSYTLKLDCEGEKTGKDLQISANVQWGYAEARPSAAQFLINGTPASALSLNYVYYSDHLYYWWGGLTWNIPISGKKCGDSVTLAPSTTNGYIMAAINYIRATFEEGRCDMNVRVSPSEVRPQKTGGNIGTPITISWSKQTPPDGCTVNLSVEPVEYSGGHSHSGNRPKGTLSQTTVNVPGNQTAGSIPAGTYKSSEVSGEEMIIAKVKGVKKSEAKVTVQVPGLEPLGSSIVYNLSQSPEAGITHPSNHYGLPSTNDAVFNMAFDYAFKTDTLLGINDMSLEKGGLFDYKATWAPPHSSHRKGTSVDINSTAQSMETWEYVNSNRALIKRYCERYGGHLVREGPIHCEFSN